MSMDTNQKQKWQKTVLINAFVVSMWTFDSGFYRRYGRRKNFGQTSALILFHITTNSVLCLILPSLLMGGLLYSKSVVEEKNTGSCLFYVLYFSVAHLKCWPLLHFNAFIIWGEVKSDNIN